LDDRDCSINNDCFIPNGCDKVHGGSSVTKGQLFTLIYAFTLRHCLSKGALSDLITLINTILPGSLPHNIYFWNKIQNPSVGSKIEGHLFCDCGAYITKVVDKNAVLACEKCQNQYSCKNMLKIQNNVFSVFPLEEQLRLLLEKKHVYEELFKSSLQHGTQKCDIAEGSEYKRRGIHFPVSISLTCNTDGVPVFSSSNASMWPVYFIVNELPLALRHVHMIMAALWVGSGKPSIQGMLVPIVESLKKLEETGLLWMCNGTPMLSKVFLCIVSCDSVARPLLQNMKQFNGKYGCGFCLCEGHVVSKGRGHVLVYTGLPADERTNENMFRHAEKSAENGDSYFGIKGPSIFSLLPNFDMARGFVPEYMHSVLLGCVRQFVFLWFDSSSHDEAFYLGRRLRDVDAILLQIKPPSEIKRLPRSLNLRKYWKASEWRNFLLFYFIHLSDFLPKKYFDHWCLLAFAVYSLLSKHITKDALIFCDLALHKFVTQVEELYGKQHVSYNVHLLTHLTTSVERWGPLWCNSAFLFEDANGKLLTFFHGTRGISQQIFKSFIGADHLQTLVAKYVDSSNVLFALHEITNMSALCIGAVKLGHGITALGNGMKMTITAPERVALSRRFDNAHLLSNDVTHYNRIVLNGMLITTASYSQSFRNSNCYVSTNEARLVYMLHSCVVLHFCRGLNCIVHEYEEHVLLLANRIHVTPIQKRDSIGCNLTAHINRSDMSAQELVVLFAEDISHKVYHSKIGNNGSVFINLPQFELD
jgi:hypothetical protein